MLPVPLTAPSFQTPTMTSVGIVPVDPPGPPVEFVVYSIFIKIVILPLPDYDLY